MRGNKPRFCTRCGVQIHAPAPKYCPDCRYQAKLEEARQRYAQQKQSGTLRTGPKKKQKKAPETLEQWLQRHGGEVNYGKIVAREEGRI